MASKHIAGLDEAGRGPVIGPLVIRGVALSAESLDELSEAGVKDSKKLSSKQRKHLAGRIEETSETVEITELTARTIDRLRRNGVNMNRIEAIGFASILKKLGASAVYADSVGPNPEKFADTLRSFLCTDVDLTVECRADEKYVQVSAASILAKVRMDERIRELEEKHGEMGSGYPSDEQTVRFLEKWVESHAELPGSVRKSWKTVDGVKRDWNFCCPSSLFA
ncbi:hypothetical protein AKJ57_03415 [candidate division MSBL1 archaeon SCGC-AAA259A05]|uniref:Ribonuclease HII n=1 Tax=candidate division MSBL1 archaeon SCGC-AAA259A05 TaxID=1698259 RepID=A0A133U9K7_9EURY|nr:hypothetical protein AKJ57_03415 [candidate division MSBL1 archaeon SCGC-AAA259A05]